MSIDHEFVTKVQQELADFTEKDLPWIFERYPGKTYGWLISTNLEYFFEVIEHYDNEGEMLYTLKDLAKKAKQINFDGFPEFKAIYEKLYKNK